MLACQQDKEQEHLFKQLMIKGNINQIDLSQVQDSMRGDWLYYTETSDSLNYFNQLSPPFLSLAEFRKEKENLIAIELPDDWLDFSKLKQGDLASFEKLKLITEENQSYLKGALLAYLKEYATNDNIDSYEHLYKYLLSLEILGNQYAHQSQQEKYWTLMIKAVHTIDAFDTNLHVLKNKFILNLLINISREFEIEPYQDFFHAFLGKLSSDAFEGFEGLISKAYLVEEDTVITALKKFDQEKILLEAHEVAHSPFQKMRVLLNLGFYYESAKDFNLSYHYYEQALNQFQPPYHKYYYTVLFYMIPVCSDEQIKKELIKSLKKYNEGDEQIQSFVEFVLPQYINLDDWSLDLSEQMAMVLKSRQKSNELYPNFSSLHLQDYYGLNYMKLHEIFQKKSNYHTSEIQLLMQTALDTRVREKYRQQMLTNTEGDDQKINDNLLSINEFKSYDPDSIARYEALCSAYLNIDENIKNYQTELIDFSLLYEKLSKQNDQILHITSGREQYGIYYYDGARLKVGSLNKFTADSLAQLNFHQIKDSLNVDLAELALLFDILPQDASGNLIVIHDGAFSSLPLKLLFDDLQVYTYSDIQQYIGAEDHVIKEALLYSYTDSLDCSNEGVIKYPELLFHMDEVVGVQKKLAQTNTQTHINTCQFKGFDKQHWDLLHISSHAYSSSENRLENFFLSKDKNGEWMKNYGYQQYHAQYKNDVVILSACDSGIGIHAIGAGVQTLSRAFLDNGSQTVIKTLWKVDESATIAFMADMYEHWSTGISLYEALDLTQKAFANHEEFSHPYYWAGFVLEGNPNIFLSLE